MSVSIDSGKHRAAVRARRDELVESHLDLARSIAKAVGASLPKTFELDDLISTAYVGLLTAATRYNPSQHGGTPFSAYARPVIRGAILDSVRRGRYIENTRSSITEMPENAAACSAAPEYEAELDGARSAAQVREAVALLPAKLKTVVDLHYRQDLRFPAVGSALQVGKSRASQLHMEALRELRTALA